ncbi:restriction endonuclease [Streptomyces avermitilis]|uniref:restriction endonuclease n=1 Tax=Streptomyces avermitilis TaxID=33903 RepID=UPI0038199DA0
MGWESSFVSEFERLQVSSNPHLRGRQLEDLLERLFQSAHFRVQRDAGAAHPRQTDLVVGYDDTWYVVEAKWEKGPVGVDTFDGVRARMERAVPGSIGVIISVAGFTDTVLPQVVEFRGRQPVLLIGERELLQVFHAPESLANLLKKKRDELIVHGRAHLDKNTTRTAERRPVNDLPAASLTLLGGDLEPLPYITAKDGFAELVFVHELPDVDWVIAGGNGVTVDLPVRRLDENGLVDLVHTLNAMGWTTAEPSWSIRQATTAWHGTGAREFVNALTGRKKRYDGLEKAHHTEHVTYFDTCAGGGFYTLTADVSSDPSRIVLRCNISFHLVGIPVDMAPLRHLFERYDAMATGFFRPLTGRAVTRRHLEDHEPLEAIGYLVSCDGIPSISWASRSEGTTEGAEISEKWVTGIVARNPYYRPERGTTPEGWPAAAESSEFIICALRSHHPLGEKHECYSLISWELARTSDAQVFRLVADW